jgi:hypothetical protein
MFLQRPFSELDDGSICHGKYGFAALRMYSRQPRKFSEGGKNAVLPAEIKAGQAQRLAGAAVEYNAGMHVAAKSIEVCRRIGRIMCQAEATDLQGLLLNADVGIAVPFGRKNVVVAAHQHNALPGNISAPASEKFQLDIGTTVKEIADHHELLRLKVLQERQQALHVFFHHCAGNRDAFLTKMPALAQVQVGKQQHALLLPIKGTLAGKPEVLLFEEMEEWGFHWG